MRLISRNGIDHLMYQIGCGSTAEIFDIVVNSERGIGIGTDMLNEAVAELTTLGIKRLFAFTREENYKAHKFYEKHGFMPFPIKGFYPDGNAVLFVKHL